MIKKFTRRGQSIQVERHGIKFQSITEADAYSLFLRMGVSFQHQKEYVLQHPIPKNPKVALLEDAGVHKIKCTVDFEFERDGITYIIDTKGSKEYVTERSTMAYHLLKGQIYREGRAHNTKIVMLDKQDIKRLSLMSMDLDKERFWREFLKIQCF